MFWQRQKPFKTGYTTAKYVLRMQISDYVCNVYESLIVVTCHQIIFLFFKNESHFNGITTQSLTENLGPNGRIGRRKQKLPSITNQKYF